MATTQQTIPFYAVCDYYCTYTGSNFVNPTVLATQVINGTNYTFKLFMDCGLNSLTTVSSGYYFYSAESQYFIQNLQYYNLINFPTVYYLVPIAVNYNSRSLSIYTQSESDNQYSQNI
jgi:hypothetical protein